MPPMLPAPCLAAIVNIERLKKADDKEKGDIGVACDFYMHQTSVLDNACGLIAMMHGILNNPDLIPIAEGSPLAQYRDANLASSAGDRATSLEGFEAIQAMHKSEAKKGQTGQPGQQSGVKHHFVTYVSTARISLLSWMGPRRGHTWWPRASRRTGS